jgi:glycosyltransferase involved in cell wall biosynthesis
MQKIIYFTNSVWFLYTYRLNLMLAMKSRGVEVIAAAPREDKYTRLFEQHGIRLLDVPVQMWSINPLEGVNIVLHMLRLYRQEKPDAVHSFALKANIYGSIAAHLARVPVIINTFTGLGHAFAKKNLLRSIVITLLRVALKSPVWATFQNPDDQNLFHSLNLVRDRSTVIMGSGIDTKRFSPLPDMGLPPSSERTVTFLMFSKLIWSKGVREYIEASKQLSMRLREKGCNGRVKCVLLGGARAGNPTGVDSEWLGHPDSVPAEWIEDIAAKGDIEWISHDEDILPHIHRADVVVLPSYYREGIPRSLIEAMSCGKPIITTDTPGCRESVDDGVNGLLVPPKNVNSLADAMLTLTEDNDLRRRMGKASRERVIMLFSDQLVINKTFDVYKKAGLKIVASCFPK